MTKRKKVSPVTEAIVETAADMHKSGIMDDADYTKITMRHLGKDLTAKVEPVSPAEIKSLREPALGATPKLIEHAGGFELRETARDTAHAGIRKPR